MIQPPSAKREPQELTIHDHTRIDPYYWLRERENKDVLSYLEAENRYTTTMMAHTTGLQEQLYNEMVGRIQETDRSVPVKDGPYHYYTRTEAGQQYKIYCRRPGSMEAPEEILLDPNTIAAERSLPFLRVGLFRVSPDHKILAYALDASGAERYTLYFKELESGTLLPKTVDNIGYDFVWAADNRTFFYTKLDDAWRDYQVWRTTLEPGDPPVLVKQEEDALYRVSLRSTRDKRYILLGINSIESSEWHFAPAAQPESDFTLIAAREAGVDYFVAHHSGTFYINTNADALDFKVITTPVAAPGRDNWTDLIPHQPGTKIDRTPLLFRSHMVLFGRENGLKTALIYTLDAKGRPTSRQALPTSDPIYALYPAENRDFESDILTYEYTSLTTPDSTFAFNMATGEQTLLKQEPVLGGFDRSNYRSERVMAPAEDGTLIPVSLVYRADTERTPETPCLLYGYGSYGASTDPIFRQAWLSLLDRGMICALAHIRGGEEMGRQWYDHGKFLHKKNSFTDFVAAARHLIDQKYTSPNKLAIMGRSAGGLLMGAVLNLAPELFRAAVAGVPFVDVVTTMLDESIPLTVGEYEEWGNPHDPVYYDYMLSYSPYDNVTAKAYPHILATAGLNDPRVQYWEPAKWVAKLRTLKTDQNRLLLKTNMGAGHSGASGRYDYLREIAFDYAFLLDCLEIE